MLVLVNFLFVYNIYGAGRNTFYYSSVMINEDLYLFIYFKILVIFNRVLFKFSMPDTYFDLNLNFQ